MAAKVNISMIVGDETGTALALRTPPTSSTLAGIQFLITLFTSFLAGVRRGRVRVSVDESTGVKAALTLSAIDYDDGTVGDKIYISVPGQPVVALTAVASATPAPGTNTYSIATSDNACATSIALAINTSPQLQGQVTALDSSATVVITAFKAGKPGNDIAVSAKLTTGTFLAGTGNLTGGVTHGSRNTTGVTMTIAAAVTANDTLTIGSVVLTAKASPSGESQWAGAVSQDADTAALVACINAHSKLKGIYTATYGGAGTGLCTIVCNLEGRALYQTVLAKSMAQGTLSATTIAPPTTDTWVASSIEYAVGGSAA